MGLLQEVRKGCAICKTTNGLTYSETEYYLKQPPKFYLYKSYKRFMMEKLNPENEMLNELIRRDLLTILKKASKHRDQWHSRSFLYSNPNYIDTLIEEC